MILNDLTLLFDVFDLSHFGTHFRHFFGPISGPPLEELLALLGPQGADLASPCRFGSFFWTALGSKMAPWSAQVRPEMSKKDGGTNGGWRPRGALDATCVPKGSREPFLSLLGPLV